MKLLFIRHGKTKGNSEKRYVGSTDESVLPDELNKLKINWRKLLPCIDVWEVAVSPMIRCLETAEAIFGDTKKVIIEDFTECNFGDYEYKNYSELKDFEEYQRYIDSNGEEAFPRGENKKDFTLRSCKAFEDYVNLKDKEKDNIVIVAHGGTIMAIMDRYSVPHKDYFEWQLSNGEGIIADIEFEYDEIVIKNYSKLEYNLN